MHFRFTILKVITFTFCLFLGSSVYANKLEKGFKALSVFDYFRAKTIFLELQLDQPNPYSAYGLAVVHSRNDNSFFNIDSALKYVNWSYNLFAINKTPLNFTGFSITSASILSLIDTISNKQFQRAKKINTIASFDSFLENNYLSNKQLLKQAIYLRDELEFAKVIQTNKSDTTAFFMKTHPSGNFREEALALLEKQFYEEATKNKKAKDYIYFIKKYPTNKMVNDAYDKLYSIYKQTSDAKGLATFVEDYPNAAQNLEAWKLLFSLSVKSYSYVELKKFLNDYPNFPLKNSILKELELNNLTLYTYQKDYYTGYVDDKGKVIISAIYDAASDFYEGLAVVHKNDSVYYINKENTNTLNKIFADAHVFRDGIAPVKINSKWCFMNRQGFLYSKQYDEINELIDDVYIVKINGKYGALNRFGQILLEPKFEKLGDFKNGFAYYNENGLYGFVSKNGIQIKAEFDWISDFDMNQLAIFKKNNKYGIVNSSGKKILESQFDLILKTKYSVFIVVNNGNYGFFSATGCFITPLIYEYLKEKNEDYYTNGVYFKLLKKGEQALMDENGAIFLNFGIYSEVNFLSDDLLRVKRKNKYGYIDKKLNVKIPFTYDEAGEFANGLAIVKTKETYALITCFGKEVFSANVPIEKLSTNYFLLNEELKTIIDKKGEVIFNNVLTIQKIDSKKMLILFSTGEIKLLND